MKAFPMMLLAASMLVLGGCGEKAVGGKTGTVASAAQAATAKELTPEEKFAETKKEAEAGDAEAMFQLSKRYENGDGVEKNQALADTYLQKAVGLNHPEAIYRLGGQSDMILSLNSFLIEGANPDEKLKKAQAHYLEAVRLYTKASEVGHVEAQQDLAFVLLNGLDYFARENGMALSKIPEPFRGSVIRALPFFEKAAANEQSRSMVVLYRIYNERRWGRQDKAIADAWMNKLKSVTEPSKIAKIGDILYYGAWSDKHVHYFVDIEDFKPVREWVSESKPFIIRASEAGEKDAQALLSRIYLGGFDGYQNFTEAAKWLEKASTAGDVWAQVTLGRLYMNGNGVIQDYSAAAKQFEKAASSKEFYRKVWEAQYLLGVLSENGLGLRKDLIKAHAWYNIAAANQFEKAEQRRKIVTLQLSQDQLSEAQKLAKNWKKGDTLQASSGDASSPTSPDGKPTKQGTGTAFAVSSAGHALTNHHVINGCTEVKVAGREGVAKVITSDSVNDLALLQLPGKTQDFASLNPEPGKLRQGEDIIVFGYPLEWALSSGGNLTPGTISALTGLGNNTNQIQITAPIQPGSSGSPVMDKKGDVVGVVAMKLSDSKMAKATGQIGQNVNFAVNGQTVRAFLDANQVPYKTGGGLFSREKSNADIAEEARKWTVLVECWK